jgi:Mn2+/Fe2+ NRAMP family transporter
VSFFRFLRHLGPGLLYAGAAIGVSHLVQSTRAGVNYGFDLIWVILLANLIKYPFFEIATRYTIQSNKTLLEGYQVLGKWSLFLVGFITLSTGAIVIAAISLVTGGLATAFLGFGTSISWSILLLTGATLLVLIGKHSTVANGIKWIVIFLSVLTFVAVLWAANQLEIVEAQGNFSFQKHTDVLFLVALIGWMPAPLDISFWTSFWVKDKVKTDSNFSLKKGLIDFHLGYWGTTFLAVLFLLLGALIGFQSNISLSARAGEFSIQLIELYTNSLGNWTFWIIAPAAFAAMVSTLLTVIDGYSKTAAGILKMSIPKLKLNSSPTWVYAFSILSIIIILYGVTNMGHMVDFITSVSFVTAPILGSLNLLVLKRSGYWWKNKITATLSIIGLICLILFTLYFIYIQWIN